MTPPIRDIIRQHCRPLEPQPTGVEPKLRELGRLRAVLFDVYGTLLISASGEVGTAADVGKAAAFAAALSEVGLTYNSEPGDGVACLLETIRAHHEKGRSQGVQCPEVDIVEVWRDTLNRLRREGTILPDVAAVDLNRLAAEYEVRTNPVWPMPNLLECLAALRGTGLVLGIVSNAQFLTVELFPALLGRTVEDLGFDPRLQYYSYLHHRAKPSLYLYQIAGKALSQRGVRADQVLCVGNDMLNDILPASKLGFRTALFAGDARSLRFREGDPRVRGIEPDLVVTDLSLLNKCIPMSDS